MGLIELVKNSQLLGKISSKVQRINFLTHPVDRRL